MRVKPDRRESYFGLGLCIAGCALGTAFSWWTEFGWLPLYLAGLAFIAVATPFPVKFRPWPLFPLTIMMILFASGVPFVALFAGGSLIHLLNVPLAATYIAGVSSSSMRRGE